MSWMQQLYATYEQCARNPAFQEGEDILLPIYHSSQQAHIEVIINERGRLVSAEVVNKEETVLPVTEKSAGRTSGEAPHGLADKIQYCAGDYNDFDKEKKSYFCSYMKQLEDWCGSPYCHPKVSVIFNYLRKKTLVADLVAKGILHTDENGQLISKWPVEDAPVLPPLFKQLVKDTKTKKYDQGKALVRWKVQIPGDSQDTTWRDRSIFDSWEKYCLTCDSKLAICHVSGKNIPIAANHPRRIRHSGDGAKIVSVPVDKTFYTFKGRFVEENEACTVGAEVTQKAHNVLRWLITRQGYRNDDQVVVSWAASSKDIPKITDDSLDFLGSEAALMDESFDSDVGQRFALKLSKKIAGYHQDLGASDRIMVMALASGSKGRISIAFYRELSGSDFLKVVEKWHLDFAWPLRFTDKNQSNQNIPIWRCCAPSPKNIAEAAYGENVDNKLRKKTIERLLPCIVDGTSLPKDLLESSIRRASNPVSMEFWQWQKSLGISCALYKGYYARITDPKQRRDYEMALERERKNRDYLYGRLLAVAEQIESWALFKADEKRITGAERLMLRFSRQPCSTWKTIEESLRPYKDRLRASSDAGLLHYWETEIEQVCSLFNYDDFVQDSPLSGEYLLGYYCQKHYKKAKTGEQPGQ